MTCLEPHFKNSRLKMKNPTSNQSTQPKSTLGGSLGLVVTGGGLNSRGQEFESECRILDC